MPKSISDSSRRYSVRNLIDSHYRILAVYPRPFRADRLVCGRGLCLVVETRMLGLWVMILCLYPHWISEAHHLMFVLLMRNSDLVPALLLALLLYPQ